MVELFANSGDPYQMPQSNMHCFAITLLGVSRLQLVEEEYLALRYLVIILG